MKQTVHNIFRKQFAPLNPASAKKLFLLFFGTVLAFTGMTQTYATKAAGNWNSAATWVSGSMPGTTIGAGKTVIVKHAVTFNQNSDLVIAGTLNIEADTLRFDNNYSKKISIQSTGVLNIKNAGLLQNIPSNSSEMEVLGGRIVLDNAKMAISKSVNATAGARRTFRSSTVLVGEKYGMEGTAALRTIDSIQNSTLEVGINSSDFEIKPYCTIRVSNAKIIVGNGKLLNSLNSDVTVLPGSTNNYGFNILKINTDLENIGAWDARIDAFCIGGQVAGSNYTAVDFTRPEDCSASASSAPAPELSFVNPVLVKGTANKEGAEYRFSNITTGVDAIVKLKKFSRSDIVMKTIDNSALGWNKAFQPEFGLSGLVLPFQNWYVDFEMSFYEAGTNKKTKVQKADFTALDVDGDGHSISEYAVFSNPASVAYSTVSSLTTSQAGSLGSLLPCGVCAVSSALIQCNVCQGTGDVNGVDCSSCSGSGARHSGCNHGFQGMIGNILQGPVANFANIDTNGTAVMATYQYQNVDKMSFRYGAKSGANSSNGSGIRLNSLWSKSFNLTPFALLPVTFSGFDVQYSNGNANLNWNVQHADELSHFVVQRSTDGVNFSDAAVVFADAIAAYRYTDKNLSLNTGVVYYRIVSVDRVKEIRISGVKAIRLNKLQSTSIHITTFPNPVINEMHVTLPANWQGKNGTIEIYRADGVLVKVMQTASASQTETVQIADLTKGIYVVKATFDNESATQRIVKN